MSRIESGDGKGLLSDLRSSSWEDGDGKTYRFKVETRTNEATPSVVEGTAERTDKGYVIDGVKVWTSGASLADYCLMLARTGPERYDGISIFLVPMDTPGVTARPIPNFMGEFSLHETVFDHVEVPFSALLGEGNQGWQIVRHEVFGEVKYGVGRD